MELDEILESNDPADRQPDIIRTRRHSVFVLLDRLRAERKATTALNSMARLDAVIAVLEAGCTERKTITLPDGAGLMHIEQHLGIPDEREDAVAWRSIRQEFDDRNHADAPPAIYVMPRQAKRPSPAPTIAKTTPNRSSGGRTRQR